MKNPKHRITVKETPKLAAEYVGPFHWRVQSESDPTKAYDVFMADGNYTCTCEWTKWGGHNCKHVRTVMKQLGAYAQPSDEAARRQKRHIVLNDEMPYVIRL